MTVPSVVEIEGKAATTTDLHRMAVLNCASATAVSCCRAQMLTRPVGERGQWDPSVWASSRRAGWVTALFHSCPAPHIGMPATRAGSWLIDGADGHSPMADNVCTIWVIMNRSPASSSSGPSTSSPPIRVWTSC